MAIRTIDAPGIEIREIDKSQYSPAMTGTKVLVTGFANSGEDYTPMIFTSKSAWLNYYGEPDNEAERYFYAASMEVLNQNGVVNCCKLPYENEARDKFVGFKYKLNTTEDFKIRTVYEQISFGGELSGIGEIIDRSQSYQKDLIAYFLQEFNVVDATDKENLQGYLKESTVDAKTVLEDEINQSDRSDGKSGAEIKGKTFLEFYAHGKSFNEFEKSFREQMTKSELLSYSKEIDLTTSELLPKLPVCYKFNTITTEVEPYVSTSAYYLSDTVSIIDTYAELNYTAEDIGYNKMLKQLSTDSDIDYRNALSNMVVAMKSAYPVLSSHESTSALLTGTQFNSSIVDLKATDISKLSVFQVIEMANEMEMISLNGLSVTPDVSYAGFINTIKGQVNYLNDAIEKGYTTDSRIVTEDGKIEQSISVLIPYLKEEGSTKFVSHKLYELTNSSVVPFGKTPEDVSSWFKITSLDSLGIFNNDTPELSSDDALYVQFESDPSAIKITEEFVNGMNLFYKEGYEWAKLEQMSAISEDYEEFKKLVDNHAYQMSALGDQDFSKVFEFIDEINENRDALNETYRATINDKLLFNEIRQADDTIDIAWKIEASGNPSLYDLTQVDEYRTDESRVGTNQILIVDKTRKPYGKVPEDKNHKDDKRELIGVIPVITTAANALYAQSMIDVDKANVTDYETIYNVKTLDASTSPYKFLGVEYKTFNVMETGELSTTSIISQRLNNDHTKEDNADDFFDSVALEANNYFSSISLNSDGGFDRENMKKIGLVVVKAFLDASAGNKISFQTVESFVGSLDRNAKNPNTGATTFIDTLVNEQSEYVNIFTNCMPTESLKKKYNESVDIFVMPHDKADVASLGFYEGMCEENIDVSESILKALDCVYDKVSDINERDIDIVVDGGVSNIAQFIKSVYGSIGFYDPASPDAALWKCKKDNDVKMWKTVIMKYDNLCKNIRKDCMFIADGPRPYCLQGQKKIIRPSKPKNTIDAEILPYTKYLTGLNTSYGAGYCDWFQIADEFTGDYFWCPPSIKACGAYIYTDLNYNYWDAPAGLNRGIVAALDVAFSPTNKQAGQIYTKSWNYAINYPQDGIVLEGQKTLQTKPSALDRVNVRRLMLRLERAVYQVLRYVVYEGNTAYLRQRTVDLLDPYFQEAKVGGGIYDYKIIADETVNTPATIDRNEFHIKIGIKPTKTIEFIMVDFVLLSTGADWSEML